jgi:hypothetical protein
MGKPSESHVSLLRREYIAARERTRGSETSQYPEEKKTKSDSGSSGERNRKNGIGVAGPR